MVPETQVHDGNPKSGRKLRHRAIKVLFAVCEKCSSDYLLCSICSANFEPQIQVKSKAVDTGRNSISRAPLRPSEGPVHYGHGVDTAKSFACAMKRKESRLTQILFERRLRQPCAKICTVERSKLSRSEPHFLKGSHVRAQWKLLTTPTGMS